MKLRPLFYALSLTLLAVSVYSIVRWNFKKSIDFSGGSVWEVKLPNIQDSSKIQKVFSDEKISLSSQTPESKGTFLLKFPNIDENKKKNLDESMKKLDKNFQELRFETLGPSLGRELLVKTVYAIILSAVSLLIYIGSRFDDFSFGAAAVLAMFHDTIILIGAFSLLGHFFGAEIDSLFVTALLTTLSSSVHDTVVTFDRIRELRRTSYKYTWTEMANKAVTEVIVRSINNSMTVIFMLFALVVLGGQTTRWFAMALLIGVVCGTYSSTGVAIPLVLLFKNRKAKALEKK
ncbi:MAG TPA: protein translocase subunit SecF [Patescibacteria group bacterium]